MKQSTFFVLMTFGLFAGCRARDDGEAMPRPPALYPATGRVTVDGRPLPKAMVLFLAVDGKGTTTQGETDEDGYYEMTYQDSPGTAAARYQVCVTKLVTPEGEVVGRDVRGQFTVSPKLLKGQELVPKPYSDMSRTPLMVTVPVGGGTFNFDIKGPLDKPSPLPSESATEKETPPSAAPSSATSAKPSAP